MMPIDLLVIVLGTNDSKTVYQADAERIAEEARQLIRLAKGHEWAVPAEMRILMISPVPMDERAEKELADEMSEHSVRVSREIGPALKRVAEEENVFFANAADWRIELGFDGCHYTEKGHTEFAQHISEEILKIAALQ